MSYSHDKVTDVKIRKAIDAISKTLQEQDLEYGEALTAMSFALILSAKQIDVDKQDFMRIMGIEWDAVKHESEEQPAH